MGTTFVNFIGNDRGIARKREVRKSNVSQDGYALLLMVFFVAMLLFTVSVATPRLLTLERREKEKEMVWRGKEYVRGIRLYYRKTRRLPTQLDDLYLPKTGIRFMRGAYKDPMNSVDGSWRLIFVSPDGRIIGSLRQHQNTYLSAAGWGGLFGSNPSPAASPIGGTQNSPSPASAPGSFASLNSAPSVSQNPSDNSNSPGLTPAPPSGTNALTPASPNTSAPQSAAPPTDNGPTPAVNMIIGVGSKIDKRSILWLDGEKNYLQFEFVWNLSDAVSN
jgi:hypothetical protein